MTQEEHRQAAIWQVLSAAYIRVSAAAEGRPVDSLSESDRVAIVARWSMAMVHDLGLLTAVMEEARRAGIADANNMFRKIDTADQADIDTAIEYASELAARERDEAVK